MRKLATVAAAALSIGCTDADPCAWDACDGGNALVMSVGELSTNDADLEPAQSLCFAVDAELMELLPSIETLALIAGDWWHWPVEFDDGCDSLLTIGDVVDETGRRRPAVHHALELPDGSELPGSYVGGLSVITFDRESLLTEQVVDTTPRGCRASAPQSFLLAHVVLAHEMGHMLGVPHCDDCDGALMADGLRHCEEPMPTADDLARALAPSL